MIACVAHNQLHVDTSSTQANVTMIYVGRMCGKGRFFQDKNLCTMKIVRNLKQPPRIISQAINNH